MDGINRLGVSSSALWLVVTCPKALAEGSIVGKPKGRRDFYLENAQYKKHARPTRLQADFK